MSKFWNVIKCSESMGELHIYGEIASTTWWGDEVTPKKFKADLDDLGDIETLNVYINSPGGDVFAGQTIYTMLKRHRARVNVYIDGVAASIASVIAMAGDRVIMPKNAMMMLHNPYTIMMGNAEELRKRADALDKICESMKEAYLAKATSLDREILTELLDAESWLSAQDCVDYGFADEVEDAKEVAACMDDKYIKAYKNVPVELIQALKEEKQKAEETPAEDKTGGPAEDMRAKKEKLLLEIDLI